MKNFDDIYEAPVFVAEGGQGQVYRLKEKTNGNVANDAADDAAGGNTANEGTEAKYAALKLIKDKKVWEREVYILKNADHPLFPEFYDAGEEDGVYYILMEYIWGENMCSVLKRRKGFAQQEAMRMALSVADGLGWLQTKERPVIFRDLKAENIIMTPEGNVRLVDMGSARFLDEEDGTVTGTPGATAPEQMDGISDMNSDVYAFGQLFHFMLTGINPAENPEESLTPITSIDSAFSSCLDLLIQDCTGVVPEERIPDMYLVTQRMVEIASSSEREYKKMEKQAAKEIKNRIAGDKIIYKKDIRK